MKISVGNEDFFCKLAHTLHVRYLQSMAAHRKEEQSEKEAQDDRIARAKEDIRKLKAERNAMELRCLEMEAVSHLL